MRRTGSIAFAATRVSIACLFIDAGIDVLRKPGPRATIAAPTLRALRSVAPQLPADDVVLVRANAALQVLAGLTLLRGKRPRSAALALACSLVPTTAAGHSFWQLTEPAQRGQQRLQFEKNLAILGGLLSVAASRRAKSTR